MQRLVDVFPETIVTWYDFMNVLECDIQVKQRNQTVIGPLIQAGTVLICLEMCPNGHRNKTISCIYSYYILYIYS